MGMPGFETALEEMMCRVLGDFIEEGFVAKHANDLYCGSDFPEALLNTGDASFRPSIVVTFVFLPQRPLFAPRPPLFSAGYGPKAGYQLTRIVSPPWHRVLLFQL